MIVFDIGNEYVQLAQKLSGNVMKEMPEQYAFLMNYREYQEVLQIGKSCKFITLDEQSTILSMVAASLITTRSSHYPIWCVILDSPYLILWIAADKDKMRAYAIVDAVMKSSEGI
jgi:hypothetical protein